MPIVKTAANDRRVTASKYNVSQWTATSNTQRLYANLASASDPNMMKADNLLFDPKLMVGSSGLAANVTDHSYRRFDQIQIMPIYYYVGSFIILLTVLKYLTK